MKRACRQKSVRMSRIRRQRLIEDFMLAANETVAEDYLLAAGTFFIPDT